MKTVEAVAHFGNRVRLARALGIEPSAVSQWGEQPPRGRQFQIELLTRGQLKAVRPVLGAAA